MFLYILMHSNSNLHYNYCMGEKSFYFSLDTKKASTDLPHVS